MLVESMERGGQINEREASVLKELCVEEDPRVMAALEVCWGLPALVGVLGCVVVGILVVGY